MAVCINGHQMDRYAGACPTCGGPKSLKWATVRRHRREEQEIQWIEHHWVLIPILVIGLIFMYLIFGANREATPETQVCSMARGLLVSEFAPTGAYGAFHETQQDLGVTVGRILKEGQQVGDPQLKVVLAEVEKEAKANDNDPDLGTIGDLVSLCRSEHYIS